MKTYTTVMFDRLDKICHEEYGSANGGIVEYVLDHNPGLEASGIVLAIGTIVKLPTLPDRTPDTTKPSKIFLWA